ncbi:hypothetical protein [Thermosphaera sp.]
MKVSDSHRFFIENISAVFGTFSTIYWVFQFSLKNLAKILTQDIYFENAYFEES